MSHFYRGRTVFIYCHFQHQPALSILEPPAIYIYKPSSLLNQLFAMHVKLLHAQECCCLMRPLTRVREIMRLDFVGELWACN
jgi:hypothetical protein